MHYNLTFFKSIPGRRCSVTKISGLRTFGKIAIREKVHSGISIRKKWRVPIFVLQKNVRGTTNYCVVL